MAPITRFNAEIRCFLGGGLTACTYPHPSHTHICTRPPLSSTPFLSSTPTSPLPLSADFRPSLDRPPGGGRRDRHVRRTAGTAHCIHNLVTVQLSQFTPIYVFSTHVLFILLLQIIVRVASAPPAPTASVSAAAFASASPCRSTAASGSGVAREASASAPASRRARPARVFGCVDVPVLAFGVPVVGPVPLHTRAAFRTAAVVMRGNV